MNDDARGRVTVIGGGLDFSAHPSVEACRALRTARTVFHAGCHPDVAKWLSGLAKDAAVVDVDEGFYVVGQYRPDMYRQMASRVVSAAAAGGEVALIEPGSAMITDLVTPLVLAAARQAGVATRVIPGISSLEHVFIAFGVDPSTGFQAILAQELVARRLRLNPDFDSVVIQPGYYDTLWCAGWPRSRPDRFLDLVSTLALAYGLDQPMALVRFPMHPGDVTHRFWFELRDLTRLSGLMTPLHSLFIPAVSSPDRRPDFQARMHLWERSLEFLELDAEAVPLQHAPVASNGDLASIESSLAPDILARARELDEAWPARQSARALSRIDPSLA